MEYTVDQYINAIKSFLSKGDFANADKYGRYALKLFPSNGELYFLMLLISHQTTDEEVLISDPELCNSKLFQLARQYGDEDIQSELDSLEDAVMEQAQSIQTSKSEQNQNKSRSTQKSIKPSAQTAVSVSERETHPASAKAQPRGINVPISTIVAGAAFLVVTIVLIIFLVRSNSEKKELTARLDELQAQITAQPVSSGDEAKVAESAASTGDEKAETAADATADSDTTEDKSEDENLDYTFFSVDEPVKTDIVEFTVDKIGKTNMIEQSNKSGYYSYYEADNGKTFVYLHGDIKNVGKQLIDCKSMYIQYVFDSGYEYTGQIVLEKEGEFETFSYLDPLESGKFYIFTDIPNDLVGNGETVTVKLSFNDFTDNRYSLNGSEKNRYAIRASV